MTNLKVRAATPADADHIKQLALDNHMFEPDEMGDFEPMLAGFFNGTLEDHHWIVAADANSGTVAAAAYYAPEPFADRMWNLYFKTARALIVDTSSVDDYNRHVRSTPDGASSKKHGCGTSTDLVTTRSPSGSASANEGWFGGSRTGQVIGCPVGSRVRRKGDVGVHA